LPIRWSFKTPLARAVRLLPEKGPLSRDPLFAVVVDQAMDHGELLKLIELRAADVPLPIHIATKDELDASHDDEIQSLRWREKEGHWLAFRCDRPLPLDSAITVRLAGSHATPARAVTPRVWRFRTAGPFVVKGRPCEGMACGPSEGWRIEMSNPVEAETVTRDGVRVTPEVPDLRVTAEADTSIWVKGRFSPRPGPRTR
jgi:hypothetical protein